MTGPSTGSITGGDVGHPARRALAVAGVLEPVTLLVLVANLATVHLDGVAALVGPLHGTAYLVAIVASWTGRCPRRARLLAWLPGVGALLAARVGTSPPAPASPSIPPED